MSVLEKIKRKEEYINPFAGFNFAIEQLIVPSDDKAIITLSELKDREIRNMTILEALNTLFKYEVGDGGKKTVLDIMRSEYLLLKMARNRRRIREILTFIKAGVGKAQMPIMLKPVKKMLYSSEE